MAGAFISSIGLSLSGWHHAAESAFGIGVFFWVTVGTLILGRLFTGAPLPGALKPSLAILVSRQRQAGSPGSSSQAAIWTPSSMSFSASCS